MRHVRVPQFRGDITKLSFRLSKAGSGEMGRKRNPFELSILSLRKDFSVAPRAKPFGSVEMTTGNWSIRKDFSVAPAQSRLAPSK